jgi:GT2 family glycosyltransferase
MGVESAKSERILFMDDDTILFDKDTLKNSVAGILWKNYLFLRRAKVLTKAEWEYSYIKQKLASNTEIDTIAFLPKGISRETGYRDLQEFSFIGNFGGLMKTDFMKVGGFDSTRFPGRQEDVDLMYRLLLNNYSFKFLDDSIKVIHLTHPITGNRSEERQHWFEEFRKKELEEGHWFCINNLFRV